MTPPTPTERARFETNSPRLTDIQKAASTWSHNNWHEGLKIAGADSNYIAFWAFCAGAELAALSRPDQPEQGLTPIAEAASTPEGAERLVAAFYGLEPAPSPARTEGTPETDKFLEENISRVAHKSDLANFTHRMEQKRNQVRDELTALQQRGERLASILEAAQNGLQWYRETYPQSDSPEDDEMNDAIIAALAQWRDGKPQLSLEDEPPVDPTQRLTPPDTPAPAPAPDKLKKETNL